MMVTKPSQKTDARHTSSEGRGEISAQAAATMAADGGEETKVAEIEGTG